VLNVLGLLVELEPGQSTLLERICAGPLISADELGTTGALVVPAKIKVKARKTRGPDLFGSHH